MLFQVDATNTNNKLLNFPLVLNNAASGKLEIRGSTTKIPPPPSSPSSLHLTSTSFSLHLTTPLLLPTPYMPTSFSLHLTSPSFSLHLTSPSFQHIAITRANIKKLGDGDGSNLCRVKKQILVPHLLKYISVWVDPRQFLRLFLHKDVIIKIVSSNGLNWFLFYKKVTCSTSQVLKKNNVSVYFMWISP